MARHPESEVGPYVRGELRPQERERVARHLEDCPDCRQDADGLRDLLAKLSRSVPVPPAVNWGGYRAELREKLTARSARRRVWWSRPLPLVLSASLAGVVLVLALWSGWQSPSGVEPMTPHEAVIGRRLRLLPQYPVAERPPPLPGIDAVQHLH